MEDSDSSVPDKNRLTRRSPADVTRREQGWVWQEYIPRGALSLLLGQLGVGKSVLAMELVAMVTRGWKTPPSAELREGKRDLAAEISEVTEKGRPGTVLLFEVGDRNSILLQRLEAAGADLENIQLLERSCHDNDDLLDPEVNSPLNAKKAKAPTKAEKDHELLLDLRSLEQHILQLQSEGHDVPLVIIDPIESFLRDALDKARFAQLLSEIARKSGAAIVVTGLMTLTGRCQFKIQNEGVQSLFLAARTVLTIVQDLNDQRVKLVLPTKLNLSANRDGRKFAVRDPGVIDWSEDEVRLTGEQYLAQLKQKRKNAAQGKTTHQPEPIEDTNKPPAERRRQRPPIPRFSIN